MNAAKNKTNLRDEALSISEKCSLLMDGALSEQEVDELLAHYAQDETIAQDWQTYHIIGDVMRSSELAQSHVTLSGSSHMAALRKRLAQEPLIMAPVVLPRRKGVKTLRWPYWGGLMAASGFAVFALVSVVNTTPDQTQLIREGSPTLSVMAPQETPAPSQSIATVRQQVSANLPAQASVRDRRTNNRPDPRFISVDNNRTPESTALTPYLSAHQQFGYGSTLGDMRSDRYVVQTSANR